MRTNGSRDFSTTAQLTAPGDPATEDIRVGLDEAGRGPALGPLVVAAVGAGFSAHARLLGMGLQDSKSYGSTESSRKKRAALSLAIRSVAQCEFEIVPAGTVDELGIDEAERRAGKNILSRFSKARDILCDGERIFSPLKKFFSQLQAKNKADQTSPLVGAASIVAKTIRDLEWDRIRALYEPRFGPIRGGGYPNPATLAFLRLYISREGCLPPEARKSWATCRRLMVK